MKAPIPAIKKVYEALGLAASEGTFGRMQAFLDERNQGTHGNSQKYKKTRADDPVALEERRKYHRYQSYFGIQNEV
jgi:hypothetical protein